MVKHMDFDNKTILISGLVLGSIVAMYLRYNDIALAIVSGLVGYLSKDAITVNKNNTDEEVIMDDTNEDSI